MGDMAIPPLSSHHQRQVGAPRPTRDLCGTHGAGCQRMGNPPLRRAWLPAMLRGARGRCPACGGGALFGQLLQVRERCASCDEELYHQRADRLAWPLAAFVALQVVMLAMLALHLLDLRPPLWTWALPWVALFALLLRPVKGAVIGLQWALRLHGFQYAAMCRPRRP